MDPQMVIFTELVNALIDTGNIQRLMYIRQQLETDIDRMGEDDIRLMEKYHLIMSGIQKIKRKD